MNINSQNTKEKSIVELIVEVSSGEFDLAINEAYRKNKNKIAVPGFRKGKAPRKIIERMYGATVFHSDALDIVVPTVLKYVAGETKLDIVGYPEVSDVKFRQEDGGLDVTINVSIYPEVSIGDYKGLSAVKPPVEVADSEIDGEIEAIRQRNARIEKVDRAAAQGDTVIIDYEGFVGGETFEGGKAEDFELELGSGRFIPGFEEKIQGMSADEERDLDLVFPEDYTNELAGKPVVFKVKLKEVREKQLPDVDDEFVKDVSEFDTLSEYRANIHERFAMAKQTDADNKFENALLEKAADMVRADIPDVMVEEQIDYAMNNFAQQISSYGMDPKMYLQMMNTTPEEFRERMRPSSEKQVRIMLALEKIAELEGIEVSEDDIENEYKDASERTQMDIDKIKQSIPKEGITREVKYKRATQIIKDHAVIEDPPAEGEDSGDKDNKKSAAKTKKPAAKKASAKKTVEAAEEPENNKGEE